MPVSVGRGRRSPRAGANACLRGLLDCSSPLEPAIVETAGAVECLVCAGVFIHITLFFPNTNPMRYVLPLSQGRTPAAREEMGKAGTRLTCT